MTACACCECRGGGGGLKQTGFGAHRLAAARPCPRPPTRPRAATVRRRRRHGEERVKSCRQSPKDDGTGPLRHAELRGSMPVQLGTAICLYGARGRLCRKDGIGIHLICAGES